MQYVISEELAQKVVAALNVALSLALASRSSTHATFMAVANEFDDAIFHAAASEEPCSEAVNLQKNPGSGEL